MKKILLIGNGAREHAIAEALARGRATDAAEQARSVEARTSSGAGPQEVEIFAVGKTRNPGIAALATEYFLADVCDKEAIREFALAVKPDFAVIGPEAPIEAGVVDMLLEIGVHSASPLATVGRLESSKSFTRDLVEKYKIAGNPKFKVFYEAEGMREFFEELGEVTGEKDGGYVVKADGLEGGKGVKVSGDHLNGIEEGMAFACECLAEAGRVVIEEKLVGQEFSLMSFCDGRHTVSMPVVQDHKRAYEGDLGPNTGGMGTYSDADHSLPFLKKSDIEQAEAITTAVAAALLEETGCEFKGIMYGGFMACRDGVRLIEYNARFGDPEAMNVLPLLKTDFVEVCEAIIHGGLDKLKVEFEKKATVCKYLVPEGYPDKGVKGEKIEIGEVPDGVKIYYSSVDEREDGLYLAGSRAVAMVGIAGTLAEAEKLAEKGAACVKGPVFYRKDIGTAELIGKRVEMMRALRS